MNHLSTEQTTALHPWNERGEIDAAGLENWVQGRLERQREQIDAHRLDVDRDHAGGLGGVHEEQDFALAGDVTVKGDVTLKLRGPDGCLDAAAWRTRTAGLEAKIEGDWAGHRLVSGSLDADLTDAGRAALGKPAPVVADLMSEAQRKLAKELFLPLADVTLLGPVAAKKWDAENDGDIAAELWEVDDLRFLEISVVTDDEHAVNTVDQTKGQVASVDRVHGKIAVRYADGRIDRLRLMTPRSAAAGAGTLQAKGRRVIVYSSNKSGQQVALYFKRKA